MVGWPVQEPGGPCEESTSQEYWLWLVIVAGAGGRLVDVEVALNNRPLSYVKADELRPILTPNALLYSHPNVMPELRPHQVKDSILRKRARYLIKCKQAMWSSWSKEYV